MTTTLLELHLHVSPAAFPIRRSVETSTSATPLLPLTSTGNIPLPVGYVPEN
jgi:hypothetical protein